VRWISGALIVVLSIWVLHSILQALLAACVAAIASWPLYRKFRTRLSPRVPRTAASFIFTFAITAFVLAPVVFALGAFAMEARGILIDAAAHEQGIAAPLFAWTQRSDPAAFLGWAQTIGQFMVRHLFLVFFTILALFFLYQEGDRIAYDMRRLLRHRIGHRADAYVTIGTRAVRAAVNSMLMVSIFDGVGCGFAYLICGAPHPALWGAITGALSLVPFLGYVAVAAVAIRMAMLGVTGGVAGALLLGLLVLFCGDKVVRPMVAGDGTRLPFVWVLMGCIGGFEALGFVGLVVGPVALAITREMWLQRVRELASEGSYRPPRIARLQGRRAGAGPRP